VRKAPALAMVGRAAIGQATACTLAVVCILTLPDHVRSVAEAKWRAGQAGALHLAWGGQPWIGC
jgi:hypothetical protein